MVAIETVDVAPHWSVASFLITFGIQARGGCACAGPYAHRLLGMTGAVGIRLRAEIGLAMKVAKPGWTRLAFSS